MNPFYRRRFRHITIFCLVFFGWYCFDPGYVNTEAAIQKQSHAKSEIPKKPKNAPAKLRQTLLDLKRSSAKQDLLMGEDVAMAAGQARVKKDEEAAEANMDVLEECLVQMEEVDPEILAEFEKTKAR